MRRPRSSRTRSRARRSRARDRASPPGPTSSLTVSALLDEAAAPLTAARPDAEVHAVDVSRAALDVARGNATRLRLAGRVAFHEGDLLSPIGPRAGRVDLVVSNPPYVSAEEWRGLEPEVRDHEPRLALVPAEGAPALYRRLLAAAGRVLRPGGSIAVEVGQGQSDEVARLAGAAGLEVGAVVADLQGIPRVVVARRPTV